MPSKSKTLDAELMDPGMSGNVTPAKRGSEAENGMIQPEKQAKFTHEKSPTETSQQLIIDEHSRVLGSEVEPPKAVGGDDTSSEVVKRKPRGYCMIHDCFTDHNEYTCPDRHKGNYFVLYNGVYVLNYCDICKFGHLPSECPHDADDLNFDGVLYP